MIYYTTYTCPLCHAEIFPNKGVSMDEGELSIVLGKVIRNQKFAGNPYLYEAPMYLPDGSCGLATFSGFSSEEHLQKANRKRWFK